MIKKKTIEYYYYMELIIVQIHLEIITLYKTILIYLVI